MIGLALILICVTGPRDRCPPPDAHPACVVGDGFVLCRKYCGPGDPARLGLVDADGCIRWTWPECAGLDADGDDDVDLADLAMVTR